MDAPPWEPETKGKKDDGLHGLQKGRKVTLRFLGRVGNNRKQLSEKKSLI